MIHCEICHETDTKLEGDLDIMETCDAGNALLCSLCREVISDYLNLLEAKGVNYEIG